MKQNSRCKFKNIYFHQQKIFTLTFHITNTGKTDSSVTETERFDLNKNINLDRKYSQQILLTSFY